ncbi:hypothetical protein KUL118_65300 [Tenacibaculum sp. KUL118]|uniref:hypothetical protein n=1 Tax=Tenacibaculum mesophilum TaxID=104268 RepID=UPI0012E5591D|nr:hypothetical protein [Tenacibaculum mesophilum]KAF9657951.1 hypothetical protein HBA12_12075 [Tenacibaculum mesophilum]GFD83668.1 hypothetical protein KUL118_65300 [Tenacibaculum sp. KUL118]
MKMYFTKTKIAFFLLISVLLTACSSSNDEEIDIDIDDPKFYIEIIGKKTQFEEITFRVTQESSEKEVYISGVEWVFDDEIVEGYDNSITKTFKDFGTKNVKGTFYVNGEKKIVVSKNFEIIEKEHSKVYITYVILNGVGYRILDDFYYGYNDSLLSLRASFSISELDENNNENFVYLSKEDDTNNSSLSRFREVVWVDWEDQSQNLVNVMYETKVYHDGIPNKSFSLTFSGQNTKRSKPKRELVKKSISLAEYRDIKPKELSFTANTYNIGGEDVTFVLGLHWE